MITDRQPYQRQKVDNEKMNLPENKTCGDCIHFRRCAGIYGRIADDQSCDWSPSRFSESTKNLGGAQ